MKRFCILLLFIFVPIFLFPILFFGKLEKKVTVRFASWGSKSEISVIQSLLSEFENSNPNIKVDFIHIPQNYFQKLQLLFASGLEPDVIFINNQNIQMYINAGLLEDLYPYFDNLNQKFHSVALECFTNDNKLYAIPRDISNLVIFYNKDIFNKQKIKMPSSIKNIYELKDIARKVTTTDHWGINFETNPLFWGYYLASNGGGILSDDKNRIIINQQKSIEALNLYSDMLNKDKSMPSKSDIGSMTTAQMFINGKLAMYLSGRWMTPKFRETINFDWDVIEFPAPNKVYIDSSGYAVSKNSKHKKEAIALIEYLSSTFSSNKISASGLIIPANKDSFFQDNNQKPSNFNIFKSMLNMSKPTPVNENYAIILDIITEKSESIWNGKSSPDDVFDDKTISELKKYL